MRKKIPLKDKRIIKERLARGLSQREAIKGTVVQHHTTAANIAKREKADISRMRKEYIKLIEQFDAGDVDRAELWAEMTRANKVISAKVIYKKGGDLPKADEKTDDFIEVPDWSNREKALRYIDELKELPVGEKVTQQTQVNIFNRLNGEEKEFVDED